MVGVVVAVSALLYSTRIYRSKPVLQGKDRDSLVHMYMATQRNDQVFPLYLCMLSYLQCRAQYTACASQSPCEHSSTQRKLSIIFRSANHPVSLLVLGRAL